MKLVENIKLGPFAGSPTRQENLFSINHVDGNGRPAGNELAGETWDFQQVPANEGKLYQGKYEILD